jgi:hypothetical protein
MVRALRARGPVSDKELIMRAFTLVATTLLLGITSSTLASAPFTRYTVSTETRIVRDNMTGLFWQQEVAPGALGWSEADAYCRGLRRDGRDWRLPRMKELLTLIDPSTPGVLIDNVIFPNTPGERFWTSTRHVVATENYWAVDFSHGGTHNEQPSEMLRVRCVQQ